MERGSILKWVFLGLAIFLIFQFGLPLFTGGGKSTDVQPLHELPYQAPPPESRAPETLCEIAGPRFTAQLSTRGASLRHVTFTEEKYKNSYEHTFVDVITGKRGKATPIDLVTTTKESRMPLRTDLRLPGGDRQQVAWNDFDWTLEKKDDKSCTFSYADESTALTKEISATEKPFELAVTLSVKNLAAEPRKHRLAIEQTAWRKPKELEGSLGMISEFQTEAEVGSIDGKTHRTGPGDFEPDDFKDENINNEKHRVFGAARWVSTSSSYFSSAVVPVEGPGRPEGQTLVEEWWDSQRFNDKSKDPDFGYLYRSRLAYPEHELAPQASVAYKMLSFTGPKEREVLAAVGGGQHGLTDVINLGWFGVIGKVLISYVYYLYRLVGSWGWAIVLLTITVKMALFPLSLAQIKSSVAMRKLKPEMDAINAKYKDDATQRGLAIQELWRKNKVANPFTGCIPVLFQMPVWFALYQALQTAVELYQTPFGSAAIIPDLSAPGKYLIIPLVLGASSFFQQKLMPPQGDPAQQKMMMYMMPAIFTVMMLFLPAGLGVYMLTNTWLGITQQVLVERYMKARADRDGGIQVKEKTSPGSGPKKDVPTSDDRVATPALLETGKGKARVRG
jgi:YidC/Oxa1 family membrane protein insertase